MELRVRWDYGEVWTVFAPAPYSRTAVVRFLVTAATRAEAIAQGEERMFEIERTSALACIDELFLEALRASLWRHARYLVRGLWR